MNKRPLDYSHWVFMQVFIVGLFLTGLSVVLYGVVLSAQLLWGLIS